MAETIRRPNAERRFTWSKHAGPEGRETYRLFRRSLQRRVHMHTATFGPADDRSVRARVLRIMRKRLLDEVDAIDLRFLGVIKEAA